VEAPVLGAGGGDAPARCDLVELIHCGGGATSSPVFDGLGGAID
jgi:hypothetical protein